MCKSKLVKFVAVPALLLLSSCNEVVATRVTGEPREEIRKGSCTHTSYCYTMMPGFDGSMKYSFKLSSFCPGTRKEKVLVTPIEKEYEDGTVKASESVKLLEVMGACQ